MKDNYNMYENIINVNWNFFKKLNIVEIVLVQQIYSKVVVIE